MNIEKLHELFEKKECDALEFDGICADCNKDLKIEVVLTNEGFRISNGAVYQPDNDEEKFYLKCDECFEKDHTLRNFQECEVYARVVGYLRPVKQYNEGKKAEYEDRKNFNIEKTLETLKNAV